MRAGGGGWGSGPGSRASGSLATDAGRSGSAVSAAGKWVLVPTTDRPRSSAVQILRPHIRSGPSSLPGAEFGWNALRAAPPRLQGPDWDLSSPGALRARWGGPRAGDQGPGRTPGAGVQERKLGFLGGPPGFPRGVWAGGQSVWSRGLPPPGIPRANLGAGDTKVTTDRSGAGASMASGIFHGLSGFSRAEGR